MHGAISVPEVTAFVSGRDFALVVKYWTAREFPFLPQGMLDGSLRSLPQVATPVLAAFRAAA